MKTMLQVERRSSLALLADAGRAMGFQVQIEHDALVVNTEETFIKLVWPPVAPVRKSQIVTLLRSDALRTIATTQADPRAELPPWLPGYVKPDLGARGEDHSLLEAHEDWNRWRWQHQATQVFVVQPLVQGVEFRVTICRNGAFAAARRVGRCGLRSLWRDATDLVPRSWLTELLDITLRLKAPGLGCDIMQSESGDYLLDVNTNPGLAIHVATDCPRDVAPSFFQAWLDLVASNQL